MPCTLFVATQNVTQAIAVLPHGVIKGHDGSPWDAKHGIYAVLNQ